MTAWMSELVGYVTLAIVLSLLIFGLFILVFLRPRGGPEVAFARLLADSRRRTNFLVGLCTSLAALFGIGLAETIEWFIGVPALDGSVTLTVLFGVGAVGIIVLMRDALNTRPMTLAEEWILKETAARVTSGPLTMTPPIDSGRPEFPDDHEDRRPSR